MRLLESTSDFFLGVDLGQVQDFTALCLVERLDRRYESTDRVSFSEAREIQFHMRYFQRVPLGTPYPEIVARIKKLAKNPILNGPCEVIVDATGVGAPVVDLLKAELPPGRLVPVTITAGSTAHQVGTAWCIPKRNLMVGLRLMFELGEIRIATGLPEQAHFLKELAGIRVRMSSSGHYTYGARKAGDHDDLVLAAALSCWRSKGQKWWDLFGSQPLPGM